MRTIIAILLSPAMLFLCTACGGFAPEPLWDRSDPPPKLKMSAENESAFESAYHEINREILQPLCIRCHNTQNSKGGVNLSSLDSIQRDLKVFKAGRSSESALYLVLQDGSMPPRGGPLSEEMTEKVRRWIEML